MNIVWTASLLFILAPLQPLLGAQVVGHGAGHDTKPTSALSKKFARPPTFATSVTHQACTASRPARGQLLSSKTAPSRRFSSRRAWRDNPNGAFVDWNPRVSCEGQ